MQQRRADQGFTANPRQNGDTRKSDGDSVVADVARWIAKKEGADALVERWQRLEHSLSLQAKASGITFENVLSGATRGARDLRALTRQISVLDQQLGYLAQAILGRPNRSLADAVAKIRLAVQLQAPVDNDLPWELVRSGLGGLTSAEVD